MAKTGMCLIYIDYAGVIIAGMCSAIDSVGS